MNKSDLDHLFTNKMIIVRVSSSRFCLVLEHYRTRDTLDVLISTIWTRKISAKETISDATDVLVEKYPRISAHYDAVVPGFF